MRICFLLWGCFLCCGTSAQKRFEQFVGLHVMTDAQGYFFGPAPQLGTDYQLSDAWALSAYVHPFYARVDRQYTNGDFEKGYFLSVNAALLGEYNFGPNKRAPFFIGAGICYQFIESRWVDNFGRIDIDRSMLLPCLRLGKQWKLSRNSLTAEINAVGPYEETDIDPVLGVTSRYIEFATTFSIGCRYIFSGKR